jgi:transposase
VGHTYRDGSGPDQVMLMPADPREWLPGGHLAWKVLDLAREMDLSGFGASYRPDGQGGRPYHPQMMATLLLYCYCRGRRSSREIEMATYDDVGARLICGGLHPDHSTVAEFVRRHLEAACALLPESVRACAREGLVPAGLVAGDGTKLKANASMAANMTAARLDAQITELEAVIDAQFRAWAQDMLDGDSGSGGGGDDGSGGGGDDGSGGGGDDGSGGGGDDGSGGGGGADETTGTRPGKKPKRPELVLARRKAARAQLAARQDASGRQEQGRRQARISELAARVEKKEAAVRKWETAAAARLEARARKTAAGQRVPGPRPVTSSTGQDREVKRARAALADARSALADARGQAAGQAAAPAAGPDAKVNATDPSSQVMPLKKGGFDQLFNVQALATARTQVILAIMRHPSPVDVHALAPLMERAREVLDAAGIAAQIRKALSGAGYASDANFTLAIPAQLYIAVTREGRQAGRSGQGRAPKTMLPSWEEMTARLQADEGRKLYRQRGATIEPVFGQLTARLGRTLNYRGDLADAELALWAASHNILKAIKARAQPITGQARATTPAALAATAA